MLDIKFIRENPEKVKEACAKKQVKVDVDKFLELDKKGRELQQEIDNLRAQKNKLGKDLSAEASAKAEDIVKGKEIKEKLRILEDDFNTTHHEIYLILSRIPNIPFDDVPVGKGDSENIVLRQVGKLPKFKNFKPLEHFEIEEKGNLNIIDISRGNKVAGSKFYFLKNDGALLELALVNFAFDKLKKKGFSPVIPPVMIYPEMATLMGYIDHKIEHDPIDRKKDKVIPDQESYYIEKDNLYLTATSEQSLGAMHAGEILQVEKPLRYAAFSTCFRRESGSYGKDTKGIFRVHQFDKIEMFVFCKPEDSEKEHKNLLAIEEELMKALKIPYQVVNICTGDLGKPTARKYDIEAWMPGQNRYRETHSTSNCTDYQARGLEIKYKNNKNELHFVHTLNGTAFAIGRMLVAILENYQQKDGSIKIPKVLQKYAGFKVIKSKAKK